MNKFVRRLLLLAALLLPLASQAQVVSSSFRTGVDATRWITLSSNADTLVFSGTMDEGYSAVENIGFSFYFGQYFWSQFSVSTNGAIRLGPEAIGTGSFNTPFSASNAVRYAPKIVPFGRDLAIRDTLGHYVRYELTGTAPHRILVIEAQHANDYRDTDRSVVRYQVQLYEDSSKLVFAYDTNSGTMLAAQIGIGTDATDILTVNANNTLDTGATTTTRTVWPGNHRYYEFVPYIPSCSLPAWAETPTVTTTTSATLNWTGTASSYVIEYADSAFVPGTGHGTIVSGISDTTYTLSPLTPGTVYYVYLHGDCGAGDTSLNISTSFFTECVTVGLPYFYGFEAVDSAAVCWTYGKAGTTSTSYPNPSYSSSVYDGAHALYLYVPASTSSIRDWAAMPELTDPLGGLMMTFYMKNTSAVATRTAPIQVGYMTDVDDTSTFVSLASLLTNSTDWNLYTVTFSDTITYPAGARIAFMGEKVAGTNSYNYFVIDNITVDEMPSCLAATGLTAVATAGTAVLNWSYQDPTVPTLPESYTVRYCAMPDSTNTYEETASDTTFALVGLTPGTEYKVWVTPDCGGDGIGNADSIRFTTAELPCHNHISEEIGEEEINHQAYVFPYNYYYRYIQNLYTADELGNDTLTISHIALHRNPAYTAAVNVFDDVDVYLANVTATTLSNGFVAYDTTFHLVKHGMNFVGGGWIDFPLDTAFFYDGTSNLLFTMNIHESAYISGQPYFYTTTAQGMMRYVQRDTPALSYDPATVTGGTAYAYRADVRFFNTHCETAGTCAAPYVSVDSVSDTAAHITWIPGYEESEWNAYYRLHGTTAWQLVEENISNQDVMVTGLQGGKQYDVAVMGICEDSLMTTVSFSTECGPVYRHSMPFFEDFTTSATGSGKLPNCWTRSSSSSSNPYVNTTVRGGVSPTLYFTANTTTTYSTAVLPAFEMSVDSLEVIFDLFKYSASYGGSLIVGVMTDPTVDSTFVGVDTVTVPTDGIWMEMDVDMRSYTGTGRYIALRYDASCTEGTGTDYINVTNVLVLPYSTCRKLTNAYASNIVYNEAQVNVTDDANTGDNSYMVYYGTTNDFAAATDSLSFTGTSTILTDLADRTTYYCWARVLCSEENSRTVAFSFTTPPPCMAVTGLTSQVNTANNTAVLSWQAPTAGFSVTNYVVRYKTVDETSWTADTTTNNYYLIPGIANGTLYQYKVSTLCDTIPGSAATGSFATLTQCATVDSSSSTSQQAPINGFFKYGYSQSIYTDADLSAMGDTLRGIFYRQTSSTARDTAYNINVYLGCTNDTAFANDSAWVSIDSLTCVATNHRFVMNGTGWLYIPFDTAFVRNHNRNLVVAIDNNSGSYASPYPYWMQTATVNHRTIVYRSDGVNPNPASPNNASSRYTYVPSISFGTSCASANPCGAPMLICTGTTEHSLALRWFAGAAETTWNVDYRRQGDAAWTAFLSNTALSADTLTGLTNGEVYEVRVSNACSTDSTYYALGEFATQCGLLALPVTENFTNQPTGTYARPCWSTGAADGNLPTVANMVVLGKTLTMPSGAYLIAPNVAAHANGLQMHLTYSSTAAGNFVYVGVIADPSSIQSFVPMDTLVCGEAYARYAKTVHFDTYGDTVGNLCLYMPAGYPASGTVYLDDLVIDLNATCPDVDSVWNTSVNGTDASIAWRTNGRGTANSYLVEYGPAGFTPGTGTTIAAASAAATLTGLTHSNYYDVYVTPVCSTGDTTYVSAPFRFLTDCGIATVPYSMDFDVDYLTVSSYTGIMPACWTTEITATPTTVNAPQIVWDDDEAVSGRNVLYMRTLSVVALPQMNAPIDTLQVSFHARATGSAFALAVGTVDSLTPGFAASFVPVDTVLCYGGLTDTVTFCGHAGSGQYIAFKNIHMTSATSQYSNIYLEDVKVDYRPSCMPVERIAIDTASTNMMAISWFACGNPQSYQVEYGASGYTQGQGTLLTATGNTVTLTGLAMDTRYDVYVRPICAAGDTAAWTGATLSTYPCDNYLPASMYDVAAATTSTNYMPAHSNYRYGYSQVIYDRAAMAAAGFVPDMEISAFAFHPNNLLANTYYTNCRVFMKNTTKALFASSSDFDTVDSTNLVFTGSLNWDAAGWKKIEFDSAFVWDGSSNVIIAIDRDHGAYQSGASFLAQASGSYRAVYAYDDSDNVDPYTLSGVSGSNKGRTQTIPAYMFYACPSTRCAAPAVTVADPTYEQAVMTWTGEATDYEVNVKASTASVWPADIAVSAHTYTATGLQPATTYNYRVRAICDATMQSDWVEGTFKTDSLPCNVPTALTADPDFGTATMSWTVGTSETQWNLHVWNTTFDSTYAVSANPVTVGGFVPGVTYNAAVEAACGGGLILSGYSDTISFTTVICAPVTGVTVGTVTGTTAQVSWTAGANNTGSYQIEYGIAGFGSGDGTMVNATTNSATLTGLEGETSYDVYVRAVCDSEYPSVWSDKASFETPAVGIHTVSGAANVTIYPNPATDGTTVSVSGVEGEVSVTIVDMNGRTVSTHTMNCSGDCVKQMNVSSLASGAYFVRIQGEGLNVVKKLVVK